MAATNDETQPQDAGGHDEGYKYILSKVSKVFKSLKSFLDGRAR
jgi:hypothetical protein